MTCQPWPDRSFASLAGRLRALAGEGRMNYPCRMKGEFTAVIEAADEGGFWAYCPEVEGANGQGETVEEAKADLAAAIELILQDRLEDSLRGLPEDAIRDTVAVG